ncbi:uncharacterized protein LOC124271100 [Haliotis rubra]|uniref:uncharacterized protein LOC124271100 n=1 Tax=Haliotis rubra TaxID=36100 RepID=UPI001EE517C8|nr:uncharacterized protein LOC124271100 [Haliotis rubra]
MDKGSSEYLLPKRKEGIVAMVPSSYQHKLYKVKKMVLNLALQRGGKRKNLRTWIKTTLSKIERQIEEERCHYTSCNMFLRMPNLRGLAAVIVAFRLLFSDDVDANMSDGVAAGVQLYPSL